MFLSASSGILEFGQTRPSVPLSMRTKNMCVLLLPSQAVLIIKKASPLTTEVTWDIECESRSVESALASRSNYQ